MIQEVELWWLVVFVTLGCMSCNVQKQDFLHNITAVGIKNPQNFLDSIDNRLENLKLKIGSLYSQNSALLHRMKKLDEYIKRGTDMETRYVIEIIGYPWDRSIISPEEFLEHLSVSLGIGNFSLSQVKGCRLVAGMKYTDARIVAEFPTAKLKREWLRAYKRKLYEISWGDAEAAFGTKESYKKFYHKIVYLQDFLPTLCEMYPTKPVPFAINDYISPYRKRLLSYAKLLAAHYEYRFVWVSEGDIFVRKKDRAPGHYIRSERDFRCFDWRLQNEDFFWKTINTCNAKRREILRGTTKRILPWMKPEGYYFTRDEETTIATHNLLLYKRKFDQQLANLLQEASTGMLTKEDVFRVTSKYNFQNFKIAFNQTKNRNYELYKNFSKIEQSFGKLQFDKLEYDAI